MDDFEIVESTRGNKPTQNNPVAVTKPGANAPAVSGKDKLFGAAADNFGEILKLASEITEIAKLKVGTDAYIKQMAEKRKELLAEAEAYALRKKADTNSVVEKMELVRKMMLDFYEHNVTTISGEDFRIIITEIVNQMGKVEHGN